MKSMELMDKLIILYLIKKIFKRYKIRFIKNSFKKNKNKKKNKLLNLVRKLKILKNVINYFKIILI